jgi:phosphoenolpyruvate carboxylase
MDRLIPKTMSSQHPDNAMPPPWLETPFIAGDDEVDEVFHSWVRLGCQEAMWDAEGKDVDLNVVRKLLAKYGDAFRDRVIGRDVFLTYRIPNPAVEQGERKIFFETLQSIPKHFDAAKVFYGEKAVPPVFEIILPFTTSAHQLIQVLNTYRRGVVQLADIFIDYPHVRLRDIIGEVRPEKVEVIPLFEDLESMLNIDSIITSYVEMTSPKYVRVFIARSDPALNNGLLAATLIAKTAFHKLSKAKNYTGIEIYPIIGVGTMPFRGGLNPENVEAFLKEYGEVSTVTIQSAFRYDYPENMVAEAVSKLNKDLPARELPDPDAIDYVLMAKVVSKLSEGYRRFAEAAAPTITALTKLVPSRRARKLHIGMFSYGRKVGDVELPRAIPFACVLYSLGLPPELIGLSVLNDLNEEEYDAVKQLYHNIREDLSRAASYVCMENVNTLLAGVENPALKPLANTLPLYVESLETLENQLNIRIGPKNTTERKYSNIVNNFLISFIEGDLASAGEELLRAAKIRRCLG